MSKKDIFNAANIKAIQEAVVRRFGGMGSVNFRETSGHLRILEKNPRASTIHCKADFCEREENGEKLTGLSFSSEFPVMRFGEKEVLLHDSESADFSRLMNVGAILKNHDPSVIVGAPVSVWIDEQRRGNLSMRWGTTDDALKAKKEALEDKTLRGVSVGYSVREWVYLKSVNEVYRGVSGPAWVAVKWDALEASLTPVPADPSVGLERDAKGGGQAHVQETDQTARKCVVVEKGDRAMKKLKLLRAWKASDGKSYDAGVELEVDERTFAELTEGETPNAEAVTEKRTVKAVEAQKADPVQPDFAKQAREAFQAEMRSEAKRASDIRNICKRFELSDMADDLIAGGKTADEARQAVLDKLASRPQPTHGNITLTVDGRDSFRSAAVDGLLLRDGSVKIDKPAEGADQIRGKSLLRLAEECLVRAGIKVPTNVLEMVKLALRGSEVISGSTSDFPIILANTANKSLLAGYEVAPSTFQFWTRNGSLNDFKAATRIKFAEVGKLKLVAEGGKYTETKRTEKKETIQLGTYARTWTMSRQGIINDDLGAFTNTLFSFGMQARMLPNDLAVAVLTDNAAMTDGFPLFSTQHANYSHETDRRLDTLAHAAAALKYMMGLMAQQKTYQHADEDARYLNLRPKVWLVSMVDEIYARQTVASGSDPAVSNAGVPNPFSNLGIQVVGEQNIATSSTDYRHYVFADPRLAPVVEVAFLQGNQKPYMEEMDQTDADGRKWLCRLDCGAAAVDSVGAVLEVGTD